MSFVTLHHYPPPLFQSLTAEVTARGHLVEELHDVGDDLIAVLSELDCKNSPKALEIARTVNDITGRYDQVHAIAVDRQQRQDDAVLRANDTGRNVDSLLTWLEDTEQLFERMQPVSVDRDALAQQIQAQRVVAADVDAHRQQVDAVAESCRGDASAGSHRRADELLDRYDAIVSLTQSRGGELDDVVTKVTRLHGNVQQLEAWLATAVQSLKRESSSDFDANSLKEKIEALYRQKQAKQTDLDSIKAIGRELINDPATGDKNRLRETLADVQSKWHDLTELLVQMISFAVS